MRHRSVLEVRESGELQRVGSCTEPMFYHDKVIIESATVTLPPAFRLRDPDVRRWLKSRMIVLTRILEKRDCVSTSSWVCRFVSCENASEVGGMYVLRNLVLGI